MSSVNKYIVVGYLGKDPELNSTSGGTSVCKFSVATNHVFMNKDNKKVEETDWHNIVTWSKTAENCGKYLKKGSLVYVEGRHRINEWENDGNKFYRAELIADRVQFLGGKNSGGSSGSSGGSPPPVNDDDIPF